ncbi:hypothetical protein KA005_06085 [bacterium]|nr:hypothetical protein [bacterium]
MYGKTEDGIAKVPLIEDSRILVIRSIVESREAYICKLGYAFVFSTDVLTLTNTNPHLFMWFKNTSVTKSVYIKLAGFGWNGGSANQDKVMKWGWVIGANEPTANHTEAPAGNLNFASSIPAEALIYKWDGVGEGMTYTGGVLSSEMLMTRGFTPLECDGIPIVGPGGSFGMAITGEEIGEAVVSLRFFYE